MVVERKVVHARVASVMGVPSVPPTNEKTQPKPPQAITPPAPGILVPPIPLRQLPEVKNIRAAELRGDFARVEWDVARMPGLAYKVWLDGVAMGVAVTEPRKELSRLRPGRQYKVEIRTQPYSKMDRRAPSKKAEYSFTTPREITSVAGPPAIDIGHAPVLPTPTIKEPVWYFDDETLKCKELGTEPISKSAHRFKTRGECYVALRKQVREGRGITPKPREIVGIEKAKEGVIKRKLSARVEELMKKRAFPKAVKEAIEKGLEQKEAPHDIERIIEKVAKINEPNYILKKTIARRIARGDIVQYKVDTDKGTIIYVNADENTANAILGMPTPTGEVIPLQIKVIR